MKIAEFDYVDLKGKESHRVVFLTGAPSNKYSGIDLTKVEEEDAGLFINEYQTLQENFQKEVELLKEKYDVKHNFRQFLEQSVSNLVIDEA